MNYETEPSSVESSQLVRVHVRHWPMLGCISCVGLKSLTSSPFSLFFVNYFSSSSIKKCYINISKTQKEHGVIFHQLSCVFILFFEGGERSKLAKIVIKIK